MTEKPTETTEFVVLQSAQDCQCGCNMPGYRQRFFTTYREGDDPRLIHTGEVAYEILGYASTVAEAQQGLYGRPQTFC